MIGGVLRVIHHALVVLVVVFSMAYLSAQAIVDPRYVEFSASADHDAVSNEGAPLVTSYSLAIHAPGAVTPLTTVDLGKPDPNASNIIRVDFLPLLEVNLAAGVNYEARVTAIGPGGAASSSPSNQFSFAPAPCSPTIAPSARTAGQEAGTGTVSVTAGAGCAWTAQSNASWITLTGGGSGSGSGTVSYSVTANTQATARVGTVAVAGHVFTLTQAAIGCTFSITPTAHSMTPAAGSSTASVTAPAGCAWTAASNNPTWLSISSGGTGSGNGVVTYAASVNSSSLSRIGTLTVAGQALTVTQEGTACSYTVSPTTRNVGGAGGSSSTAVSTSAGCSWTSASNSSWITLTSAPSRNGSGSVNFTIAPNQGAARSGTLTVAGRTVTVSQSANACSFSLSPTSRTVHAGASTNTVQLSATSGCAWTVSANVSWLSASSSSGIGSRLISYSVAVNPGGTGRTGRLTIGGQVHTITQSGATTPARPGGLRIVTVSGGQ